MCLLLFLQTEKSSQHYRGIFHALSSVFREEGPRALYKGWLPSVIGVVSEVFVHERKSSIDLLIYS